MPDQIVESIRTYGPASDAKLAQRLGLVHQIVNQTCRRLESQGLLTRSSRDAEGNIENRLSAQVRDAQDGAQTKQSGDWLRRLFRGPTPATPQSAPPVASTTLLTEDEVKQAVKQYLEARGSRVEVRWNRERGIDIEATGPAGRLVVEAKGEVGAGAQQVNYFLGALGELTQRMSDVEARYGLALPDHPQYRGLVSRLPRLAKERFRFVVFWVRRDPTGFLVEFEE